MKFIITKSNSFVLGEVDNNGKVIEEYGFPKGGLSYLIKGNNVKFYLSDDYFYKNVVWSADAPLLIDGVYVSVESLPDALKRIFILEKEEVVVDTEFDTESFNAIANAPVSVRFNNVETAVNGLQDDISSLSGEVSTLDEKTSQIENTLANKADKSEIPDVSGKQDISGMTAYTEVTAFTAHTADTDVHVTTSEKQTWNNKSDFSGSYNDLTDKPTIPTVPTDVSAFNNDAGYITASDIEGKQDISGMTAYTEVTAFTAHTADSIVHVTAEDKTAWNAKLDESDIETLFGAVQYDSNSKRINFYNKSTTGSVLAYVDATDFIKDGMVDNVEIKTLSGASYLAITFNSDAGKEEIDIPISDIFDASNYYTKQEVDTSLGGKQDTLIEGRAIDITNNTISLDLPISAGTGLESVKIGYSTNIASGTRSIAIGEATTASGYASHAEGMNTVAGGDSSFAEGHYTEAKNWGEHACGTANISNTGSTDADKTLFSIGNGANPNNRHNAFEIRRNGDIYLSKDGSDVKLQDNLFSGNYNDLSNKPTNVSAFNNDAGYITASDIEGKQDISGMTAYTEVTAFTAHTADTDVHVTTSEKSAWNAKLDASAYTPTVVDAALSPSSTNPVQNKAIYEKVTIGGGMEKISTVTAASYTSVVMPDCDKFTISASTAIGDAITSGGRYISIYDKATEGLVLTSVTVSDLDSNYVTVDGTTASTSIAFTAADGYYFKGDNSMMFKSNYSGGWVVTFFEKNDAEWLKDNVSAHTANTTIHVTASEKQTWNAKSDFSGSYNDLTDKPTIPTTTSAVTSGSTAAVESGGVYTQMGGLKLQQITQAAYDALVQGGTVDPSTVYIIVN